jgi:gamma-glutamylputrescine oxidase
MPIWTYVITTKPLGERLSDAMAYRGAVTDTDLANNHYRVVDGDRLLWSGRSTTWEADPRRFAKRLQGDIARVYPQLGETEVEYAWSGVLGSPLHRMPQIGELSPGLWLASGFGGHGLNTTAMAANIIAQAVAEGDDTWRLFAPFELVWAGGRLGRAAMQVYYWTFSARERWAARQAREREEEFRRAGELAALRAGGEQTQIEAKLGAVVPPEQLPQEPALAQLPGDPVAAEQGTSDSLPMQHGADRDRAQAAARMPSTQPGPTSTEAPRWRPTDQVPGE